MGRGIDLLGVACTESDGILALNVTLQFIIAVQTITAAQRRRENRKRKKKIEFQACPLLLADGDGPGSIDLNHVPIRALQSATLGDILMVTLLHLRLAIEEEVNVVTGKALVERRRQLLPGHGRPDQPWRHDDDEIGFLLLVGGAAEQRAQNRHGADPGKL